MEEAEVLQRTHKHNSGYKPASHKDNLQFKNDVKFMRALKDFIDFYNSGMFTISICLYHDIDLNKNIISNWASVTTLLQDFVCKLCSSSFLSASFDNGKLSSVDFVSKFKR